MMRVSFLSLSVILSSLGLACALIVVGVWFARRKRDTELREHAKPLLIMPTLPPTEEPRLPPPVRDVQPMRTSPVTALAVAQRLTPEDYHVVSDSPEQALVTMTTGETVLTGAIAEMIQGTALRFHRPADASRALLPGHLQVVDGSDAGLDVRFVRLNGEPPVISFGRSEGPPFRHVQLLDPTVSRTHARMEFDVDGWSLTNLSRTNPVLVNGSALTDEVPVRLQDGDRIEMGALTFRYHWR
ncbi:MAG: FHA domain-containing protein [Gemmatimonadaceae bacterium]|nr:FHA domain-containing protein [Gemmatimonadaceae bacterium]